jgi:hypothetical protein
MLAPRMMSCRDNIRKPAVIPVSISRNAVARSFLMSLSSLRLLMIPSSEVAGLRLAPKGRPRSIYPPVNRMDCRPVIIDRRLFQSWHVLPHKTLYSPQASHASAPLNMHSGSGTRYAFYSSALRSWNEVTMASRQQGGNI